MLDDATKYRYLTQGNVAVGALDDRELYRELVSAFDIMGVPSEEQNGETYTGYTARSSYH